MNNLVNTRPAINHASTANTYGVGNASYFGHVKVSDTYATAINGGNAAGGIAASQHAIYNAYNTLSNRIGITTRNVTSPIITTNSFTTVYVTPPTVNGYTCAGVVGWYSAGTLSSYANYTDVFYNGSQIQVSARALMNEKISCQLVMRVLYIKS